MPRFWLTFDWYADRHRYAVLLATLLALLAVPPVLMGFGMPAEWSEPLLAALMLVSIASLCYDRRQRAFAPTNT